MTDRIASYVQKMKMKKKKYRFSVLDSVVDLANSSIAAGRRVRLAAMTLTRMNLLEATFKILRLGIVA